VRALRDLGRALEELFGRHGDTLKALGREDLASALGEVAADISYFAEGLPDATDLFPPA
jgi:hypothetical protein